MATTSIPPLHKLCLEGDLKAVQEYVSALDRDALKAQLDGVTGAFEHTPLHVAASRGRSDVLDFLLSSGGDVNRLNAVGCTPLHVAASKGNEGCVRVLLKYNADVFRTDRHGKTPKQRAHLRRIIRLLTSKELVKGAGAGNTEANKLAVMLRDVSVINRTTFSQALLAAVMADNLCNIGWLIMKGAPDVSEALQAAKQENKPKAVALLTLVKAAQTNDCCLVASAFEQLNEHTTGAGLWPEDIPVVVPLEVARRCNHSAVRKELLFRTDVTREDGTVCWDGLHLCSLESEWLLLLDWTTHLMLAWNCLRTLPCEMACLTKVVQLELQCNNLAEIPPCLLQLPSLCHLNLSSNELTDLPTVPEWSSSLTTLDLSHNKLTNIVGSPAAISLTSLDLSNNRLSVIPACLRGFVKLSSLDLQNNVMILRESQECLWTQCNLTWCTDGNTENLCNADDSKCTSTKIQPLEAENNYENTQVMKILLLGESGVGKTTLASTLSGSEAKTGSGLVISTWKLKQGSSDRQLHLNIWDVSRDRSNTVSQCFLSEQCICLLLFNLNRAATVWGEEIRSWVEPIAAQGVPGVCLILVGTHLDEVPSSHQELAEQDFLHEAANLSTTITGFQILECIAVALKGSMNNVQALKEMIWQCVVRRLTNNDHLSTTDERLLPIYSNLVKLGKTIRSTVQKGACKPILTKEEFNDLVCKSDLVPHEDTTMVEAIGDFLSVAGVILHYNNSSHGLSELYFVDPQFLCRAMLQTTMNSSIRSGVLHMRHLSALLGNNCLVFEYLEQFIGLLSHYNVAMVIDNETLLIPWLLPSMQPVGLGTTEVNGELKYMRHFVLSSPLATSLRTVHDFWSQLLLHIMHFVPKVRFALESSLTSIEKGGASGQYLLIPNIPGALPHKQDHPDNAIALWWRRGITYHDSELEFQVEPLGDTASVTFEGVLVSASRSPRGAKLFGQLVKMVACLLASALRGRSLTSLNSRHMIEVKQVVPCHICMKLGQTPPHKFRVGKCFSLIATNKFYATCKISNDHHTVALSDLVPDLMLYDIDPSLILSTNSLIFAPGEAGLSRGNFSAVYRSQHKGISVAVKVFCGTPRDAFTQLRKEVTLLHNLRHPYVVPLIGALLYPTMALVMEEAPLGSLDKVIIKRKQAIHRVTLHRIAAEVAAALGYLHTHGIARIDCRASDVLVWSLDPDFLFHCKLADFGTVKELVPNGVQLAHRATEYVAPEALRTDRGGSHLRCDKRANVYSYAMFLYQLIARREPFTGTPCADIQQAVMQGERPGLQDVPLAETAYFYLTRLMKRCWDKSPGRRPTTSEVVDLLSLPSVQSIMAIRSMETEYSVRSAHLAAYVRGSALPDSTLWVCCDGTGGVKVVSYSVKTMTKQQSYLITDHQLFHCSLLTPLYLWVCTSKRHGNSELHAFNVHSKVLEKWIPMQEHAVCCLEYSEGVIYCGTHEGLCLAFNQETGLKCAIQKLSDCRIEGLTVAPDLLWASTLNRIFLLDFTTLQVAVTLTAPNQGVANIGQLKTSLRSDTVWSANIFKSERFSSWSKDRRIHNFDVNAGECIRKIDQRSEHNNVISALVPVLDTAWVSMVTGHIMVFHNEEVLTWFRPYREYVRFLTCLHCEDPYHTEEALVISGAKDFIPSMVSGLDCKKDVSSLSSLAVTLVMWEAFPAKRCQQIQFVHDNAACLTADGVEVTELASRGGFKDAASVSGGESAAVNPGGPEVVVLENASEDGENLLHRQGSQLDTLSLSRSNLVTSISEEPGSCGPVYSTPLDSTTDILYVRIFHFDGECVEIPCLVPVILEVVLSKLGEWQMNNTDRLPQPIDSYVLSYYLVDTIQSVFIKTQLDLDRYIMQPRRPPLILVQRVQH